MSSQEAWPPPPVEPDEPFDDDALLKSLVLGSRPWSILTRSTLARQLRRVTKEDRRTSVTVVNDFCDRFQILLKQRVWEWWLTCVSLVAGCIGIATIYIGQATRMAMQAAPTRAAALHFYAQGDHVMGVLFGIGVLIAEPFICLTHYYHWRWRRDAVAKLSS